MWPVIFYMPGEAEIPLLAQCRQRADVRLLGVLDPDGVSPGTALAEIMGLPVHEDMATLEPPARCHVVAPRDRLDDPILGRVVAARSLRAVGAAEFKALLATSGATLPAGPPRTPPESSTAGERAQGDLNAAMRTLGRIEDAHDRDKLMPWLLSVAMAAVGGSAGSLMLHDARAETLFIAAAEGLSKRTLHRTRQPLDTGVAGRVARNRRPELVLEPPAAGTPSERAGIAAALSVPLVHDGDLLGVLNVSAARGEPYLDADHLDDLANLGGVIAAILHATSTDRHMRAGPLRRRLSRELDELATGEVELETVLAGWSAALAMALGADHVSLGLVLDDGALLLSEGTATGETRSGAIPQQHPAWNEVLQSERPVVVRQAGGEASAEAEGLTIFFLPVGPAPVRAVLAVRFGSAADAHRFQARAGEVAGFLEPRLAQQLRRHAERDHGVRLRDLTAFLGERSRNRSETAPERREALERTLRRLTGARDVLFILPEAIRSTGHDGAARELLARVGEEGWLITVTAPGFADNPSRTCLAVRAPGNGEAGFVLFDKHRLHPTDSSSFTEFDAILARHVSSVPLLDGEPRPASLPVTAPPAGVPGTLLLTLIREIDRADRYHVSFSLSAFVSDTDALAVAHVETVAEHLRTSDLIFPGEAGELFVVAPEETHGVAHLERRVVKALCEAAGDPKLAVRTGRAIYPGRDATPEAIVETALRTLTRRARDDD